MNRNDVPARLWEQVAAYPMDDAASAFPYSRKLASENGWSEKFAERVIEEYRRFVYLGMVAGHPVSPSDAVDQAWHLHQLYSRDYWERFCPDVLGRPFHHGPSRGGDDESSKFERLYERTKLSYAKIFGEPPPEDIWPTTEKHLAARFVRVDVNEHVIVRVSDFPVLCRMVSFAHDCIERLNSKRRS